MGASGALQMVAAKVRAALCFRHWASTAVGASARRVQAEVVRARGNTALRASDEDDRQGGLVAARDNGAGEGRYGIPGKQASLAGEASAQVATA